MCYVFHVEPSAGAMAKTIEAACKLRYQKVLDAHTGGSGGNGRNIMMNGNKVYMAKFAYLQFIQTRLL
jgi:hypothetical protein